ncbi:MULTISPECIES: hypothetical protein [Lacticaseibacillus]|uniref:hypothetical protein n=1 Tax=Lacticaseibacillus TaxID=2759736 RepID=UPI0018AD4E21|nr:MULTISPECIES: hypothetical protein [Lacticaseibacillus]MCG4281227.1 hypothetical protein [Lacticaseibacillus saniviri]QPI87325.1 hypothetical protein I3F57_10365 [Lacticaseibacillus paracasei subsp. tolerans]
MSTDVKIENRAQFINDFHENVPFQSDEDAEDQLEWIAMHAHEYPDSQVWMGAPGGLTNDHFPKRFWFNVNSGEDGHLILTYSNVDDEATRN